MAHPPEEEEFVDPTERETEFFNELEPVRSFHPLGHSSPFIAETRTPFSTLVKDLTSLALAEKKGALEGLFILPRLILPNNMRGRLLLL